MFGRRHIMGAYVRDAFDGLRSLNKRKGDGRRRGWVGCTVVRDEKNVDSLLGRIYIGRGAFIPRANAILSPSPVICLHLALRVPIIGILMREQQRRSSGMKSKRGTAR
jgi:hypothetical protein